jgi:two-component system, NarL family, response regulator YdfI
VTLPADLAVDLASGSRASTSVRQTAASSQPLTRREMEVLGMLAEGLANKNIAARLGISEHTVKTHVASILTKLDAFSRAEAVAIGARQGLILL